MIAEHYDQILCAGFLVMVGLAGFIAYKILKDTCHFGLLPKDN